MDNKEEVKKYADCPFCEEIDFDLTGLKYHLLNYCEKFRETDSLQSFRDL